jgi:phage I-like protein
MTMANNELLLNEIKQFFEENESFTKKDLVSFVSKSFDSHKLAATRKKSVKEDDEKPKREPTAYQLFVKANLHELKAREDAKGEGEEKLKQTELIKEVAKMWKEQQTSSVKTDESVVAKSTAYQLFVKANLPELKAREDAKGEGEEKLKQTELIKEVAKMWKEQQTAVKKDEPASEAASKKRGKKQ